MQYTSYKIQHLARAVSLILGSVAHNADYIRHFEDAGVDGVVFQAFRVHGLDSLNMKQAIEAVWNIYQAYPNVIRNKYPRFEQDYQLLERLGKEGRLLW